jgi:uncharacterized protein YjiS (DUF1127 family)
MPPQQTKLTPEPDAAGPGFDFALASVEDALPEKQTAGPPPARSILHALKGYWRSFQEKRQRDRLRSSLNDLNDRQLLDIGLTQGDIDCIVAYRAFEELKDGTAHLWMSRGVM